MSDSLSGVVVNVALIEDGRVLLTKREDFEVWCLPAGEIEWGESLAEAAVREARERLGVEVALERLVGLYSRPLLRGYHTAAVFAGRVVDGDPLPDPGDVVEIGWFGLADLPDDLLWGQRERIVDALSGAGGSAVRSTDTVRPADVPWGSAELYASRDASDLSRADYYGTLADRFGPDESMSQLEPPDA